MGSTTTRQWPYSAHRLIPHRPNMWEVFCLDFDYRDLEIDHTYGHDHTYGMLSVDCYQKHLYHNLPFCFQLSNTLQRMLSSSLSRLALGASVPRMAPALISTSFNLNLSSNLNLAPALNPIMVTQTCALHTTEVVERARQSTRARKKKINDANKKKKEERLRKNPPPIPKKVILQTILSLVRSPPQI